MKITICVKHFGGLGGQEGFISKLTAFLLKKEHQVKVIAVSGEPVSGIDFEKVSIPPFVPRSMRAWVYGTALAKTMQKDTSDVSFGEQKMWNCNIIRPGGGIEIDYWIRRIRESSLSEKTASVLAPLFPKRYFDLRCERNGYSSSKLKHVIVNSQMVRKTLLLHYPIQPDRVTVVSNGADIDRYNPENASKWRTEIRKQLEIPEQNLTGVFAAHNFKLKGLREAIETIAMVSDQHPENQPQLIVLGGGDTSSYLHLAKHLGVENSVKFAGVTIHPEEYYAAADFLLFPTLYDPCANVTLEALASGLPVITTKLNGAHELLTENTHGWIVEHPSDISKMSEYIWRLTNPETLSNMKTAARELALNHSLEGKLSRIEQILVNSVEQGVFPK